MPNNQKTRKLLPRRSALSTLLAAGTGTLFIPAWNEAVEAADTVTCVPTTPTVTEGPYWVDEKLFRSDIRTDPATGIARTGIPLSLTITVQNLSNSSCSPLAGAYVDIWHCDAKGIYSDEPAYNPGGGTGTVVTSGQKFLRGYQITDDNGQVQFTTIFPGWYSGRTIHVHMRVRTYSGSAVLSNFVSQLFFEESINDAALADSAYSRTGSRTTTNASDNIYNVVNASRMLTTTTGSNSTGYSSTITVGASFQEPAGATTAISEGGVANAVSGAPGITQGAWISLYGSSLAKSTKVLTDSDLVNNAIPTQLAGVSVLINGKAAYMQYVSPAQINVLAPADASLGGVTVSVTNSVGTSNVVTATMYSVLPGLSVLSNYVRAIRYPDGAIVNGTGNAETGYTTSAAIAPGEVLSLYGTGFGPAAGAVTGGAVVTGAYPTTNEVTVTVGRVAATVLWAGLVGPGLYQINVVIPDSLADGDHEVVASVAGQSSQSTALLRVAASARQSATIRSRLVTAA